jgi:hypothetical protein
MHLRTAVESLDGLTLDTERLDQLAHKMAHKPESPTMKVVTQ